MLSIHLEACTIVKHLIDSMYILLFILNTGISDHISATHVLDWVMLYKCIHNDERACNSSGMARAFEFKNIQLAHS